MEQIKPQFIASILPFGLDSTGKYFKFSVTIDLDANIDPDGNMLFNFIKDYPTNFETIKKNISFQNENGTAIVSTPISYNFQGVEKPIWNKLFPLEVSASQIETSKISKPQNGFPKPEDFIPKEIQDKDVRGLFESSINAMSKNINSESISIFKNFKKNIDDYQSGITGINSNLKGIMSYSEKQNELQSQILLGVNSIKLQKNQYDKNRIYDTVSHIALNPIIQRICGFTFDFLIESKLILTDEFKLRINSDLLNTLFADVNWICPRTTFTKLTSGNKQNIIVKKDNDTFSKKYFEAINYDKPAKLKALEPILEKISKYSKEEFESLPESERARLIGEIIKLDSAAFTRGFNLNKKEASNSIAFAEAEEDGLTNGSILTESYVVKGHRFATHIKEKNKIQSIGKRNCKVLYNKSNGPVPLQIPNEFSLQDFSVNSDTGMKAFVETEKKEGETTVTQVSKKMLVDNAILNWAGENIGFPSAFFNYEDDTNFKSTNEEGSIDYTTKLVMDTFNEVYAEEFFPNILEPKEKTSLLSLEYTYEKNAKLLFGENYDLLITNEYKNGWALPFNSTNPSELSVQDLINESLIVEGFQYKRNEPVKPINLYLQEPLLENYNETTNSQVVKKQRATKNREGESIHHLVIRNFDRESTSQKSVRHILPPQISFEHCFWHKKIFEINDNYGVDESYYWYKKYHSSQESTEMKEYYSGTCEINYLPDPLSKGFRLEFYLDKEKTIQAKDYQNDFEFYFKGKYPYIRSWKLVVEDINYSKARIVSSDDTITIRVEKGIELFVTARTILDEKYENEFETFGNYNDFTKYGNNDLLTPPLEFTIVHAVQKPLVKPQFNNTLVNFKQQGKSYLHLKNTINLEQLEIYENEGKVIRYIKNTMPTGEIEIYAKWEDFIDDPKHLIGEKDKTPDQPIIDLTDVKNKLRYESKIDISNQLSGMEASLNKIGSLPNNSKNFAVDVDIKYDVKESKFIEKWYVVRNKSKFTSYFPTAIDNSDTEFIKDSTNPFSVKILNSKKPNKPQVNKIILLVVNDEIRSGSQIKRTTSLTRLRIYLERGRLTSGKNERVGILVNESTSPYNDFLISTDFLSITGKDIATDSTKPYDGLYRNERVLLQKSHLDKKDPYDLVNESGNKTDDLESFKPKYIEDLGCMTYLPKFDRTQNLWYFDIELDINEKNGKQLHSPFVQFSLVHYQEHSFNYNKDYDPTVTDKPVNEKDLQKDCRLSEIQKSPFIYVLGSRVITVNKDSGSLEVIIKFDETSIVNPAKSVENTDHLKTKFYSVVQWKKHSDFKWTVAVKTKDKIEHKAFECIDLNLKKVKISYDTYSNTDYRLLVLETEEWFDNPTLSFENLIENKNIRIVSINTFNI